MFSLSTINILFSLVNLVNRCRLEFKRRHALHQSRSKLIVNPSQSFSIVPMFKPHPELPIVIVMYAGSLFMKKSVEDDPFFVRCGMAAEICHRCRQKQGKFLLWRGFHETGGIECLNENSSFLEC